MKPMLAFALALLALPQETPPSITYGPRRASKDWITLPSNVQVAVDDGIEWRGTKVYLSLTCDLVAVDAKTGKTLWAQDVGAFWNRMTFVETENAAGEKVWAVELRPSKEEAAGADHFQLHDLATGGRLKSSEKQPEGEKIDKTVWSGDNGALIRPFRGLVTTSANWDTLRGRLFAREHPHRGRTTNVDFEKECVLVVSLGAATNCLGVGAELWESKDRILVRLTYSTVQSGPEGIQARPYGLIVLPRREKKPIVIERNVQRFIAGPAIWREVDRLAFPADPAKELENLPTE